MSIWDEGFEEPKENFPEEVIRGILEGFEVATEGHATVVIRPYNEIERITNPSKIKKGLCIKQSS